MLEKFVIGILVLGIIGGVAGMVLVLSRSKRGVFDTGRESDSSIRRQKRFASSFHTFAVSLAGFALLLIHFAGAFEILFGVLAVRGLIEVGLRNWKSKATP